MTLRTDAFDDLDDASWPDLIRLARSLHVANAELQPTLDAIVATAVETIGPARHAGLILLLRGTLVPQATAGEPPRVLDELQRSTGTGPCIDAARDQTVVVLDDTAVDSRWPEFSARAAELGVASMVCVPLWVNQTRLGTLSLFAEKPHAFDDRHRRLAELFATHAALALGDAQRTAQLTEALGNRDLIGQAKGILMERMRITADDAFECLSHASQLVNRKLTVVAQHLVETGELLGT